MSTTFEARVPTHTMEGLQRYIVHRLPPGSFLTAVLSNDLKMACACADAANQAALFDIVKYLYNEAPSTCWGSPEKVQEWLKGRIA